MEELLRKYRVDEKEPSNLIQKSHNKVLEGVETLNYTRQKGCK